jgi:hypothetical protein
VNMALYISEFGRDLFVSLASYLKPPISNFRVLVLGIMVLFWMFMVFIYPAAINSTLDNLVNSMNLFGGSSDFSVVGLFTLLCLIGPLGLVDSLLLLLFASYSIYKWFTEKDLLAGLRVSPNEFNEDDLMAMEKAVEQTVRIALDEIGLDPNDLKPAISENERRLI